MDIAILIVVVAIPLTILLTVLAVNPGRKDQPYHPSRIHDDVH